MKIHVLLLVVLLLLAAAAAAPAVEPDKLLPDSTQGVVQVDVRQLLDAPLVKQHVQTPLRRFLTEQAGLQDILEVFPLDPLQDISRITLAGPLPLRLDRSLLICRGRFDLARLQKAAEQRATRSADAFQIHKQGSRSLYQFTQASKAAWPCYVCFLDETTLLLSPSREPITEAIAKQDGVRQPILDKELLALLARVDGQQSIWLAALASAELKKALSTGPETEKLFSNLQHVSGSITVANGLQAHFLVQTKDTTTAGEMRKFLEGVKAILSLAALESKRQGPLLTEMVKAVKVIQVKEAVAIKAEVTKEQIDKALK